MTTSGEPPSGAGGVHEPDWIDQILERATNQVDNAASSKKREPAPIVPAPEVAPRPTSALTSNARPIKRVASPADGLSEIQWVDSPNVTPASSAIVNPSPAPEPVTSAIEGTTSSTPEPRGTAAVETVTLGSGSALSAAGPEVSGLVPQAVGRSAWDAELADVGDHDPDGWEKLSWQDLDERTPADKSPLQEQTSFGRLLREWGPVLFAAVAIALFTRLVLVQAYHIPSQSMVPTLEDGDRVVVNRLSYQFGEIERGQVVVFAKPQGTDGENDLIKRVIGLPGETIRFVDNQVYIDDFRLDEPYLAEPDSTRPRLTIPGCAQPDPMADLCEIPQGYVFMMGDNRLGSSDSRVFGPIETDNIVGRAFLRVWPLNNLGQL